MYDILNPSLFCQRFSGCYECKFPIPHGAIISNITSELPTIYTALGFENQFSGASKRIVSFVLALQRGDKFERGSPRNGSRRLRLAQRARFGV